MNVSNPSLILSLHNFQSRWLLQILFRFDHCKNLKVVDYSKSFGFVILKISKLVIAPNPLLVCYCKNLKVGEYSKFSFSLVIAKIPKSMITLNPLLVWSSQTSIKQLLFIKLTFTKQITTRIIFFKKQTKNYEALNSPSHQEIRRSKIKLFFLFKESNSCQAQQ